MLLFFVQVGFARQQLRDFCERALVVDRRELVLLAPLLQKSANALEQRQFLVQFLFDA